MATTQKETIQMAVNLLCEKKPELMIQFLLRCKLCDSFRDQDSKCSGCGRSYLTCRKCGTVEKFIMCKDGKCSWPQSAWDKLWLEEGIELGLLNPDGSYTEEMIAMKKRQKEEGS